VTTDPAHLFLDHFLHTLNVPPQCAELIVNREKRDGRDLILGQDGNDVIDGNGAADTILGGDGADIPRGGGSNDTILGEQGDDTINENSGTDLASTGEGADTVSEVETKRRQPFDFNTKHQQKPFRVLTAASPPRGIRWRLPELIFRTWLDVLEWSTFRNPRCREGRRRCIQ
jgi:hypothetical protein